MSVKTRGVVFSVLALVLFSSLFVLSINFISADLEQSAGDVINSYGFNYNELYCSAPMRCTTKSRILAEAGVNISLVVSSDVIKFLRLNAAKGGSQIIPCPSSNSSFDVCVENPNDGAGSGVVLGAYYANDSQLICTSFNYSEWTSCSNGSQTRIVISPLPFGCVGGNPVLRQTCTVSNITPTGSDEGLNNSFSEEVTSKLGCQSGCLLNGSCVAVGYRLSDSYCHISRNFVNFNADSALCNNNFECLSNICADGTCVSSGLWNKILAWFGNLFGN